MFLSIWLTFSTNVVMDKSYNLTFFLSFWKAVFLYIQCTQRVPYIFTQMLFFFYIKEFQLFFYFSNLLTVVLSKSTFVFHFLCAWTRLGSHPSFECYGTHSMFPVKHVKIMCPSIMGPSIVDVKRWHDSKEKQLKPLKRDCKLCSMHVISSEINISMRLWIRQCSFWGKLQSS